MVWERGRGEGKCPTYIQHVYAGQRRTWGSQCSPAAVGPGAQPRPSDLHSKYFYELSLCWLKRKQCTFFYVFFWTQWMTLNFRLTQKDYRESADSLEVPAGLLTAGMVPLCRLMSFCIWRLQRTMKLRPVQPYELNFISDLDLCSYFQSTESLVTSRIKLLSIAWLVPAPLEQFQLLINLTASSHLCDSVSYFKTGIMTRVPG